MNTVHFLGYSAVHDSNFMFGSIFDNSHYTFVLTSTPAEFMVDGELKEFPAGTAVLYAPRQEFFYKACADTYENDWIHFSSDESFIRQFPLIGVPFTVSDLEYCHNLIKLLTWEVSFSCANSELIINNLLQALFLKLQEDTVHQEDIPHASGLLQLRKRIYSHPQKPWNIASMAEEMHLSTGYLQILYKKTFGVSCMDDVIEGRIRIAKEQLIYTGKTINEIAEFCGYNNVEHFCRQFKQLAGFTPGNFRKNAAKMREEGSSIQENEVLFPENPTLESNPVYNRQHYNVAGNVPHPVMPGPQ